MSNLILYFEFLIFIIGLSYIFKREKLFGIYYFFLFIYAIFAQFGYMYFPELSILIKAYFGEDVWWPATYIIIYSLLLILIIFALCWSKVVNIIPIKYIVTREKNILTQRLSGVIVLCINIFLVAYFTFNFDDINWYTNQDEDYRSGNVLFSIFLFLFKAFLGVNIVLYVLVKERLRGLPIVFYQCLQILCLLTFLLIAFRLGNRTDLLALTLGILSYHLYKDKLNFKKIIQIVIMMAVVAIILYIVEKFRYKDDGSEISGIAGLITKDWYAPAHMLFAAINYSYIDPVEVLTSNIANSLIMLGYPYLQYGITELFNPGVATRSAGYAFYILTEGYMVAGSLGFVYNAFIVIFGIAFLKKTTLSNDNGFNGLASALIGCMLVNLVRGQSSYFFKYFYTFILPMLYLYIILTGQRLKIKLKVRL